MGHLVLIVMVAAIFTGIAMAIRAKPKAVDFSTGGSSGAAKFRNPVNGAEEVVDRAGLWCLLFGCFYFAYKGVWPQAILAGGLAFITAGVSWLVYPFFAQRVMEKYYLHNGWQRVGSQSATAPSDGDTMTHLKALEEMRLSGGLTQEEFDGLKGKLLNRS